MKLGYLVLMLVILVISLFISSFYSFGGIPTGNAVVVISDMPSKTLSVEFEQADIEVEPVTQAADEPPESLEIEITDLSYYPRELNITTGSTVTWVNNDWSGMFGRPHMIAARNNAFRSARILFEDSFSHTFSEPGTYTYLDPIYRSKTGGAFMRVGVIHVH